MSYFDYKRSLEVSAEGYPFYALVMALMREADSDNLGKLQQAFPEIWQELKARYAAPGGFLDGELPDDEALAHDLEILRGETRDSQISKKAR